MFMAAIAWWLFYDVCVLASVMPWCLRWCCHLGRAGLNYITYVYLVCSVKCTYKSYKCCMPRVCVQESSSLKQVLMRNKWSVMQPGIKCLRVSCKPNSSPDWSVLQHPMQFSIKRNGPCCPKSMKLLLASSENSPWQGGVRCWGQDSCPGADGIPMWVWRWTLKYPRAIWDCGALQQEKQDILHSFKDEALAQKSCPLCSC